MFNIIQKHENTVIRTAVVNLKSLVSILTDLVQHHHNYNIAAASAATTVYH